MNTVYSSTRPKGKTLKNRPETSNNFILVIGIGAILVATGVISPKPKEEEIVEQEISAELQEFVSDWRSSLLSSFLVAATTTLVYEEEIIGGYRAPLGDQSSD